jgi:hypothetical protein
MEVEWDEQELAEIDLIRLEEAYHKKELQSVPPEQLRKVHKVYLNSTAGATSRSNTGLGITQRNKEIHTSKQKKQEKEEGNPLKN